MKYLLITALITISYFSFSQIDDFKETGTAVKKIFAKIPASKYQNLVPYYENEMWGYIDKSSRKILIKPFLNNIHFFHPGIRIYFNDDIVSISSTGNITVEEQNVSGSYRIGVVENYTDTKVKSSANGFKGFEVSPNGDLISYSDLYHSKDGIPGLNVLLFKYHNQYYGIVKNRKGKEGIIDSSGKPLEGFDFNYHEIVLNRMAKDTLNAWLFVRNNDTENYSLINTQGQLMFQNEIFTYPLVSSTVFGITLYKKGNTSALFDLYNMTWILKPQTKLNIGAIYYSSKIDLNEKLPQNRDKAMVYYLVTEGEKKYFMDLKGNKYLPWK